MSFTCKLCGKKPVFGKKRSHSKKASSRRFNPNLQKKYVTINGVKKQVYVCTACIKNMHKSD